MCAGSTCSGRRPTEAAEEDHAGHIAVRAMIGYLDLRFCRTSGKRAARKLKRWAARFDEKFPELAEPDAIGA
jgi:glutathione S-transferase